MKTASPVFGIATGMLLGALLAALSIYVLSLPADSWGALPAMFILLIVGTPLLLVLFGSTVAHLRRTGGNRQLLAMWLPVLFGGGILPAAALIDHMQLNALSRVHPPVTEMHVNLSGRTITVAKYTELDGSKPGHMEKVQHFPAFEDDAYWRTVYAGHRLAPGFMSAPVQAGTPSGNAPGQLPVVLASAYPDVERIESDVERLFLYFYYPDRVEVAPSFSVSVPDLDSLAARGVPVMSIVAHNFGELDIVRLEIDGQALGLHVAVEPAVKGQCWLYGKPSLTRATAPLRVRWQYAQVNAVWHEARVTVPQFRSARRPKGALESDEVHLYIHPDGEVGAQRAQLLRLGGDKRAVRFTPPAPAFVTQPPCGTADHYAPDVARISD